MGDPRKIRNKFERPKRLWDVDRIKHDKALRREYGLKNSSEVWKATAELKKYRREARRLLSLSEEERKRDEDKILSKLARMNILPEGSSIEDVLSLEVKHILERRLQTIVFRKGLARTIKQARQLVTHGFIAIGDRKVNVPGYLVTAEEESKVRYYRPIDLSVKEPIEEEKKAETGEEAKEEKKEEAAASSPSEKEESAKPEAN